MFDGEMSTPLEADEDWFLEEENQLRDDVETFANAFFSLALAERRERWHSLLSRCQSVPSLVVRLDALKAGLEVETGNLPADQSFRAQLAHHLVQAFPLPPLAQAACRQAFVRQIEEPSAAIDYKSWEQAAGYLLAEWPTLVALDEPLVRDIATLRRRLRQRRKAYRRCAWKRRLAILHEQTDSWWLALVTVVGLYVIMSFWGGTKSNHSSMPHSTPGSSSSRLDSMRKPDLDNLALLWATNPKTGAKSLDPISWNDLLDPSKFEVEVVGSGDVRSLRFTSRAGGTIVADGTIVAGAKGKQFLIGEASLRLIGMSKEQMNVLFSRAAAGRRLKIAPTPSAAETTSSPSKSSHADKTHP